MKAKASLLGHPIHQMLIVFPLGLLAMATIFDAIAAIYPLPHLEITSFWNIVVGVGTAVVAAVFGFIDWAAIPANTRAKRIGLVHAGVMLVVTALFAASAVLRMDNVGHATGKPSLVLELGAFVLAGIGGWLGGELVSRLGIGVHEHAHADAPSSLSGRSATGDHTPLHFESPPGYGATR
jgi:uncharacterized membrane protein